MKRLIDLPPAAGVNLYALPVQPKAWKLWSLFVDLSVASDTQLIVRCGIFVDAALQTIWQSVAGPQFLASNSYLLTWVAGLDTSHTATSQVTSGTIDPVTGAVLTLTAEQPSTYQHAGLPPFVISPNQRVELVGASMTINKLRMFIDYVDERVDLS